MESMPEANGEVINQRTVQVFVPYKYLYLFDEPRMAHVSFEGSNNASYNCDIKAITPNSYIGKMAIILWL